MKEDLTLTQAAIVLAVLFAAVLVLSSCTKFNVPMKFPDQIAQAPGDF